MGGETDSSPLYIIMYSLKNTVRYLWNEVSDRTVLFYSDILFLSVVGNRCDVALFLFV